jgi:FkbH-like protein
VCEQRELSRHASFRRDSVSPRKLESLRSVEVGVKALPDTTTPELPRTTAPRSVEVSEGERRAVAAAVDRRIDEVVELWLELGEAGPLHAPRPTDAVSLWRVVSGYLRPLALLLRDSLNGSTLHRTLYLDVRPWNLQELRPQDRAAVIAEHLPAEVAGLANVLEHPAVSDTLMELHLDLLEPPPEDAPRLLMIGDCIMPEVRLFLPAYCRREGGLQSTHVQFHADFSGFRPDAVASQIELMRPSLIGLSLFSHNATPAYSALRQDAKKLRPGELRKRVAFCMEQLESAVQAIRAVTDAPILVHSPAVISLNRRDRYLPTPRGVKRLIAELQEQIVRLAGASDNVIHLDETAVARRIGGRKAAAKRLLSSSYRQAWFHPMRFGPAMAEEYADVLASIDLVGSAKALFVDLDNTLWDGVMADGPVRHNYEGQELLKELRRAGVLLVALSKNDPANIRWEEMRLQPDDFVLRKISWRPKPEAVAEAIHELDLAASAFLLLDDNPAECALVEENVPGVRALDPADPFAWRTLRRWLDSPSTKRTPESLKRTEVYREAAQRRRALSAGVDYGSMLASLELVATVRAATEADLERLLELVQRTNQFNTTTRRRSRSEILAMLESDDHHLVVAGLRDRFGDLGVVGVVIINYSRYGFAEIDSFVMSCRAMGFGLEYLLLNDLTSARPELVWTGRFIPSDRNGPAAELFPGAGFTQGSEAQVWTLAPDAERPRRPSWFGSAP